MNYPPQLDMFTPAQGHSATSKAAAEDIAPKAGTLRRRVLDWLWARAGTDEEIQDGLGMSANTERPRRVELVRAGLVVDSGKVRQTRSGHSATVWRVA